MGRTLFSFTPMLSRLFLLLSVVLHVAALRFSVNGKLTSPHVHKREHISGLDDAQNLKYFTNITLGGMPFSVQIDTGSSDLWVAGDVPNSNDTGVFAGVQYAVGGVNGKVKTAPLTFLNFSVPDQAFIQVNASSVYPAGQGLIGLGPNVGSNVRDALKKQHQGDTVLDRIFRQDQNTSNTLTVLLSRSYDPAEQYPGEITVSDILPGMQNISDQPKLTVKTVPSSRSGGQHWQVLLDPNGIIAPDGQPIVLSSKVSSTMNSSSLTVMFDTGFSLNQVPKYVADAIYSRLPGAQFINVTATGPVWTLPCDVEVNTTLLFGNVSYPVHPLDMSLNLTDSSGNQTCVGGFQPITTAAGPDYDMILGMAFLRNVYLLIDYGDFVDGTTNKTPPYAQLLSLTDAAAAHSDFVQARLDGVDTTGMQVFTADRPVSSPAVSNNDGTQTRMIVIYGVIAGSLILVFFAITAYIIMKRRRGTRSNMRSTVSAADTGLSYDHTAYHSLQDAPPGEPNHVQGYYTEVGHASMYDPYAETTRARVLPPHEGDYSGSPPKYEERDP
ncbi:aspartic peptidase domain-containing protein [Russula emetica]|nr:aspartic peptidase domain-containing protein [Russula emetica]